MSTANPLFAEIESDLAAAAELEERQRAEAEAEHAEQMADWLEQVEASVVGADGDEAKATKAAQSALDALTRATGRAPAITFSKTGKAKLAELVSLLQARG